MKIKTLLYSHWLEGLDTVLNKPPSNFKKDEFLSHQLRFRQILKTTPQ